MDKTAPKQTSNNANAPGTWPTPTTEVKPDVSDPMQSQVSDDPKAPFAADPLNAGVPRQIASGDANDAGDSEPTSVLELELGGSGTIIIGGILSEADYNPDLAGRERVRIYDQMRKGDATVRLGLQAVKKPLLAASWYVKPGKSEEKMDNPEKKTFIQEELFNNPNFSWTQTLNQILLFCDYGNSIFEKVWRQRVDGKIGWKKFAPRLPQTVWRYTLEDGVTPGITQVLPTGGNVQIPQWKLMMFVNEMEGANYEGISLLRAAYKPWFYKDTLYKIDAIASERQGMGVPIIKVPPQANPKDKARAKVIAKNMRVNEQSYIDLPIGFSVEYIDTKAKELKNVKDMVLHHDRQILKAFLAHFLDMGASSAGTKNLSDDQSELFLVSLKYMAKLIQEQLNLAIRELIDLNFTGTQESEYPTLEVGGIGQVDFAQLAQAMQWLVSTGVIVPDEELDKYVRQTMDLPAPMELADQDEKDIQRRKIGFPPPPPGMPGDKPTDKARPQRMVNTEAFSFAEDILSLKSQIESEISTRANE